MDRLKQLQQFLEESPNDSFLKYCLALEYEKMAEPEKALQYFGELMRDDENYAATYYHLGKLYEKLNRKEDAEETYNKGLQVTQLIKDQHSYSELLNAKNELINDYDVEFDN
ncbi:MAG: tetratricopeptide repeat protein [Fimbriimonadaceae bacterium]|nr:tetratricopeptide repeat protein [Chitinophagales bacterium]